MAFGYRGRREWLRPHPVAGWGDGVTYGAAHVPGPHARSLAVIFSDGEGWYHVSVSTPARTPCWAEMCFVKDLFWDQDDCVVQFHPPRREYVNDHPFCLHLWQPVGIDFPRPWRGLVGLTRQDGVA